MIKMIRLLKVFICTLFVFLMVSASSNTFTSNILFNNQASDKAQISTSQSSHIKTQLKQQHYEFIFFYSTNCQYCMDFCKTLKSYTVNHKIPITAFKLTRDSSPDFPNSILVDQKVINQYFSTGTEETRLAVPALFILNTYNMHVYPVSRSNLTYFELTDRMNSLMQKIKQFEQLEQFKSQLVKTEKTKIIKITRRVGEIETYA